MSTQEKSTLPLVSVIMPAYNAARFVRASIDAVLSQSHSNVELIVINDGSSDETPNILAEYSDKIIAINIDNSGVSAARNIGIANAKGEWLAFCDADDIWFKDKLAQQLGSINDNVWSYTDSFYFGEDYPYADDSPTNTKRSDLSNLYSGKVFEHLILENFITTSSLLIKKSVLEKFGGFDKNLSSMEDWSLWLNIATEYPIALVPQTLLKYRVYSGSTSRKAREALPLHLSVIDNAIAGLAIEKRDQYKKFAHRKSYTITSYIAEQANDYPFAIYCAWKALLLSPSISTLKRFLATLVGRFR